MICYCVQNLQETNYGTTPTNELLKDGMKFGFARICIVHKSIFAMVHLFSIYIDVFFFFSVKLIYFY